MPVALHDCLSAFGRAAVDTQILFDQNGDPGLHPFNVRQRIGEFSVTVDLRVVRTTEESFALRFAPLDLGFRISRRRTLEMETRIHVQIEQVLMPGSK